MTDLVGPPMNILHAVRALDVGGVTTYVYRLTKGLVERGHRVTILAQEGSWQEAPPAGVNWVRCRWPGDRDLVAWVAAQNFDLVNTHNYGPTSRFGSLLCRRLHLPYIMTAHGPRHVLQRLAFRAWSNQVLVVSEADRSNVTAFGGISPDRVETGFIGMDTNRFRPGLESGAQLDALGVAPGTPIVTHITRFDTSKVPVTFALLNALPALCERVPELTALLVGNGARFDEVAEAAMSVNLVAGRKAAIVMNARCDVPELLNLSSALVATATTALEGMACTVPTIGAGRTGYFGIITPHNFEQGHRICFGDHGRSPSEIKQEILTADLLAILKDQSAARCLALGNRRLIEAHYSAERMVDHVERTYRKILTGASFR